MLNDTAPDLKEQAEEILSVLGISPKEAVNIFYEQIILHNGMPFESDITVKKPLDISELTKEEFDAEPEKGYSEIESCSAIPAEIFFNDLYEELRILRV